MSSYFDEASRRYEKSNDKAILETVINRYRAYLEYLAKECYVRESDRVAELRNQFEAVIQEYKAGHNSYLLSDLHDIAHKVGTAHIELKGGRCAGDNPYFKNQGAWLPEE